jgi:hypothetical protein
MVSIFLARTSQFSTPKKIKIYVNYGTNARDILPTRFLNLFLISPKIIVQNVKFVAFQNIQNFVFCNSNSKGSDMFELVHSDIWGPALIISYNDYRYYVIFIDVFFQKLHGYI